MLGLHRKQSCCKRHLGLLLTALLGHLGLLPTAPVVAPRAAAGSPAVAPAPASASNTTAVQIRVHLSGGDVVPFTNTTEAAVLAAIGQVMHCS